MTTKTRKSKHTTVTPDKGVFRTNRSLFGVVPEMAR